MKKQDKPLIWLHGEIKSPPFSASARIEAGFFFQTSSNGRKIEYASF